MTSSYVPFVLLAACSSHEPDVTTTVAAKHDAAVLRMIDAPIDASMPFPAQTDPGWNTRFDFDGDGVKDPVAVAYSGGAHCCYTLSVSLSKYHRVVTLPFELDGGYTTGLDQSQPGSFSIQTDKAGVSNFWMRIASYSGRSEEIPLSWVRTYGIHSHWIRVDLRTGAIRVENMMWDCETALDHLSKLDFMSWDGFSAACRDIDLAEHLKGSSRLGLDRTLGANHLMRSREVIVDADKALAFQFALSRHSVEDLVVRVDFDHEELAAYYVNIFGLPEARLPYKLWGFTHPTGQWVWPARGIVVYVDPQNRTVHHVGVFAPTDLKTYRDNLEWPARPPTRLPE